MATPKLARKCYNVDSSSDDDSDSDSLLILSPIKNNDDIKSSEMVDGNGKSSLHSNTISTSKPLQSRKTSAGTKTNPNNLSKKRKIALDGQRSSKFSVSSESGTDDDDDFLMRTKRVFEKSSHPQAPTRLQQDEDPKQRKKREREAQKEKEKQDRMQKRKEAREEKERRKQEEKLAKKQQNEEHNQATGKYSYEEIAVLMDEDLYRNDPHGLVEALSADFLVHPYRSRLAEGLPTNAMSIQFIRKDKLLGGAKEAVDLLESDRAEGKTKIDDDQGYEHISYLAILFEPDDFIPLLRRDAQEEDDYPALESWLDGIRSQWQRAWSSKLVQPKIIFLLYGLPEALDKKWLEYSRHNRKVSRSEASLPTVKELQDAMQWILVQFQVECILCPNTEFLQSTVHKMTRGLADRPYINQVTELECIRKLKQGCTGSSDPLEKAKDVWIRQLQQLPGMSENKAQHIAEHFPTCQSLWQAYQWEHHRLKDSQDDGNNAHEVCSVMLQDKFSGENKRYRKLSDSLYRVLTSNEPNEMIL